MNDDSTMQSALSALRTVIAFGAGLAVSHGYLQADQAAELVGAGVVLIPLGWGMLQKKWSEQNTQARETEAVKAGVALPVAPSTAATITPDQAQRIIATTPII